MALLCGGMATDPQDLRLQRPFPAPRDLHLPIDHSQRVAELARQDWPDLLGFGDVVEGVASASWPSRSSSSSSSTPKVRVTARLLAVVAKPLCPSRGGGVTKVSLRVLTLLLGSSVD